MLDIDDDQIEGLPHLAQAIARLTDEQRRRLNALLMPLCRYTIASDALDGYRELGSRAAAAESERDAALVTLDTVRARIRNWDNMDSDGHSDSRRLGDALRALHDLSKLLGMGGAVKGDTARMVPTEFFEGEWHFPKADGPEPWAVITYTDEPSPETGDVGWCWWARGDMGSAPTYEAACSQAEASLQRRMDDRIGVL